MISASVALPSKDDLGESPIWRDSTDELLRVDILGGLLHTWAPQSGATTVTSFDGEVTAIALRRDGGLVVAVGHDLLLVDEDGSHEVAASIEADKPDNRLNDCRCDPQGRLWAGTISQSFELHAAALYRLEAGEAPQCVVPQTTLSNGIGWSPDGELMYFIDSMTQRVDVFDFDGASGDVSGRRVVAEIDAADGMPDGLTIDEEGGIWVAVARGGEVRRYSPDGQLDAVVEMPVRHPTCPGFGGKDLETLYITTTRFEMTPSQLSEMPDSGSVFACEPGVRGLPPQSFAG